MKRISIKGVILGGITDICLTFILELPVAVYVIFKFDLVHIQSNRLPAATVEALEGHPTILVLQLIIGLLCSVLGGVVAGWIAGHDEVLNGGLSSFLCLAFTGYSIVRGTADSILWVQISLVPLGLAMGSLGGLLVRRMRKSSPPRLTPVS